MEKLMTVKDVAAVMATTEAGLRWMIHQGTAPRSSMIGGRRLFRQTDVQEHIDQAFTEAR